MTLTRRRILELLRDHELAPSRALGQNFVADPNTVRRIARLAAVGPGDHVVEIGAGLGSLTLALAETGAAVTALETDRHLVPVLTEVLGGVGGLAGVPGAAAVQDTGTVAGRRPEAARGSVRLVHADARRVDWAELLAAAPRWTLVANLPYNVATPLVLDLLDQVTAIQRMVVMVQAEVGERLAAVPGSAAYGIPSVKVAYWATAAVVGRVPASVFVPRPRVDSALVEVVRRPAPAVDADPDRLFTLVRAGFGQRRKMLRRALAGLVDAATFARAGVAPDARAEQLDLAAWARLANACR